MNTPHNSYTLLGAYFIGQKVYRAASSQKAEKAQKAL